MLLSCLAFSAATVLAVALQPGLPEPLWGVVSPLTSLVVLGALMLEPSMHAVSALCVAGVAVAALGSGAAGLSAAMQLMVGSGKRAWEDGLLVLRQVMLHGARNRQPGVRHDRGS
jgi:hypothetical protein